MRLSLAVPQTAAMSSRRSTRNNAAAAEAARSPGRKRKRGAAATAARSKAASRNSKRTSTTAAAAESEEEPDKEQDGGSDGEDDEEESEDEGELILSREGSTPVLTYSLSGRVHYRGAVAPQETESDGEADGAEEQKTKQKPKSRAGGAARSKKARNTAASAASPPRPMEPHGLGEVFFPARSGGGSLRGTFTHGEMLSGLATFTSGDGSRIVGNYTDGVLCGHVDEYDDHGSRVFEGQYADAQRHGPGTLTLPDGGKLVGEFNAGVFEGNQNEYRYPPIPSLGAQASLRGEWRQGEMIRARFYLGGQPADGAPADDAADAEDAEVKSKSKAKGKKVASSSAAAASSSSASIAQPIYYQFDESTSTRISSSPLLADPYESLVVFVAPSSVPNSGEGLFAAVDLPADTVVSFYNGTRDKGYKSERRRWSENSNTISLIDDDPDQGDVDIDVAECWATTDKYCASLGHKCNHIFDLARRNAKYDMCLHPRFGLIKSIRTTRAVPKGEELFVDYGYTMSLDSKGKVKGKAGPSWYREAFEAEQKRNPIASPPAPTAAAAASSSAPAAADAPKPTANARSKRARR